MLYHDDFDKYPTSWSSDGKYIAYEALANGHLEVWVMPMFGDRKPYVFLQGKYNTRFPVFSPDGKWMVYVSNESGTDQVYVAPFPGPGGKWQISTGGGSRPSWRRDGREIIYLAADDKLMSTEVSAKGGNFEVGAVRTLFMTKPQRFVTFFAALYSMNRDAQRFLLNTAATQSAATPVTLVMHWTADLKK